MKILSIDSSALSASAAILEDDELRAEYFVNYKKTHSQTLLPMIEEICSMVELDLKSLDYLAISGGPGSFTGLRIGSSTAKGLSFVLGIPIVSVPTVDSMAYCLWGCDGLVVPLMDARRNQAYTGIYEFDGQGRMQVLMEQRPMDLEELLAKLADYDKKVTFLGDLTSLFRECIRDNFNGEYTFAPPHLCHQRAAAVGALARIYISEGRYVSAAEHTPVYLRMTQAERERMKSHPAAERN